MTEEPKVGETWIGKYSKDEKTILCIGNKLLFFRDCHGHEKTYDKSAWSDNHTRKPVKQKRWINIYPGSNSSLIYSLKQEADTARMVDRIACVEVEFV